ncbi:MAG: choice-of-anchor D domain-containing protein [Myxococcales bacterium]|nr:choice-of-anchor D domain-containing protein [Myxococcales bacterium]
MAAGSSRVGVGLVFAALAGCGGDWLLKTRAAILVAPGAIDFGPTAVGTTRSVPVELKNDGRAPVRVHRVASTLAFAGVEELEPFTLAAGESRELPVAFSPEVEGAVFGELSIETDAAVEDEASKSREPGVARVSIAGLGVRAYVEVSPSRLDFGDVEIGTVKMAELSFTNPTPAEAPFRFAIEGPDAQMFTAAEAGEELALGPGESYPVAIAFNPYRLAAAQAQLRVESCSICEPKLVELVGFGVSSIVDVRPLRIQFGRVSPGGRAEELLTVTNIGGEPLQFDGMDWAEPRPLAFALEPPLPGTLAAGQSVTAKVSFSPQGWGAVTPALLEIKVVARNTSGIKVPVTGEVGLSCVVPIPRALDFGLVPEGMSSARRVDLVNRCGQTVQVGGFSVSAQSGGFFGLGQQPLSLTLAPGAIGPLTVTFAPKPGSGTSEGRMGFKVTQGTVVSQDEVQLTGSTRAMSPCQYSLVPPALDFGLVNVGAEVSMGLSLRNDGADRCFVSSMQLAAGSDPAFGSMGAGPALLAPGEKVLLEVTFKPTAVGAFSAMAEGWVNHPMAGHPTALLSGKGVQGCFQLQPSSIDFGTVRLTCGARTRTVLALNTCSAPVTLSQASIGSATSNEMSLAVGPPLPYSLAPGNQVAFSVRYQPTDEGKDAAALRVDAAQGGLNTVGLIGQGVDKSTHTDRFVQESQAKVDLLFVVDNSGSMMEEQQSLAQNFASLLSSAQASGADYHLGVTTTGLDPSPGGWAVCPGGVDGGESGRLFPVVGSTPRIITPATPAAAQVFAANVQVGWCHWNEQGLEAAYRALSAPLVSSADDPRTPQPADGNQGFLRPDAKLAIVVVSDEEDFSPQPVEFYATFFRSLKANDPALLSFSAIVGPGNLATCPTASSSGLRYAKLAQDTGGVTESICTQNWADSLKNISSNAFGPRRRFPLTETPEDPATITVEVNGQPLSAGWSYDPSSNSVVFDSASSPAAGSLVEVTYRLGC